METKVTREQALALLKKYNQEPFHIQHALTVAAQAFAHQPARFHIAVRGLDGMNGGSAHAMNGRQGVDALARAIQNAADQVYLPGHEGGVQAVGEHLVPVLNGTERSDGGLKVFVHDFDHVHTGLLVEGDVGLTAASPAETSLGK